MILDENLNPDGGSMQNLTILGGGFAGVWAAMSAAAEREARNAADVTIALVSKDSSLTIRPRLYEGAKKEMRVPLAPLMQVIGVTLTVAEAQEIDGGTHKIQLTDNECLSFDRLVLATGSQLRRLAIPGVGSNTFSVDTFAEARRLDNHLAMLQGDATVVVIGASFTGLEVATELRSRLGERARIVLIDQADSTDAVLGINNQPLIAEALLECRIETRFHARVSEVQIDSIILDSNERIATQTLILATGFEASPLTRFISGERDAYGRLVVGPDLKVTGTNNIFAAGDTAHALADDVHVANMSCQHAIQLGRFAGYNALCDLLGCSTRRFRQEHYVTCLDLGPWGALFTSGWDRQVQKIRNEGKAMKRQINCDWIYPPSPEIGKQAIFRKIALVEKNRGRSTHRIRMQPSVNIPVARMNQTIEGTAVKC
jgi:NADH dehydrogenase